MERFLEMPGNVFFQEFKHLIMIWLIIFYTKLVLLFLFEKKCHQCACTLYSAVKFWE